jgi:hypothetical protein
MSDFAERVAAATGKRVIVTTRKGGSKVETKETVSPSGKRTNISTTTRKSTFRPGESESQRASRELEVAARQAQIDNQAKTRQLEQRQASVSQSQAVAQQRQAQAIQSYKQSQSRFFPVGPAPVRMLGTIARTRVLSDPRYTQRQSLYGPRKRTQVKPVFPITQTQASIAIDLNKEYLRQQAQRQKEAGYSFPKKVAVGIGRYGASVGRGVKKALPGGEYGPITTAGTVYRYATGKGSFSEVIAPFKDPDVQRSSILVGTAAAGYGAGALFTKASPAVLGVATKVAPKTTAFVAGALTSQVVTKGVPIALGGRQAYKTAAAYYQAKNITGSDVSAVESATAQTVPEFAGLAGYSAATFKPTPPRVSTGKITSDVDIKGVLRARGYTKGKVTPDISGTKDIQLMYLEQRAGLLGRFRKGVPTTVKLTKVGTIVKTQQVKPGYYVRTIVPDGSKQAIIKTYRQGKTLQFKTPLTGTTASSFKTSEQIFKIARDPTQFQISKGVLAQQSTGLKVQRLTGELGKNQFFSGKLKTITDIKTVSTAGTRSQLTLSRDIGFKPTGIDIKPLEFGVGKKGATPSGLVSDARSGTLTKYGEPLTRFRTTTRIEGRLKEFTLAKPLKLPRTPSRTIKGLFLSKRAQFQPVLDRSLTYAQPPKIDQTISQFKLDVPGFTFVQPSAIGLVPLATPTFEERLDNRQATLFKPKAVQRTITRPSKDVSVTPTLDILPKQQLRQQQTRKSVFSSFPSYSTVQGEFPVVPPNYGVRSIGPSPTPVPLVFIPPTKFKKPKQFKPAPPRTKKKKKLGYTKSLSVAIFSLKGKKGKLSSFAAQSGLGIRF